jgi:hypothetical protein
MIDDADRYSRQRRLPEIGDAGQARIAAITAHVRGRDGAIIETEYLYRAGVERLGISPDLEPESFVHERHFRFFAARRIGAGAWRALGKLKRALAPEVE